MESPSYLFLSAPSIKDNYYRPKFDELIRFYAAFVMKQAPGDKVIVVADAETIAAIGNRIPRANLLQGAARDIWIRDHGVIQTKEGIFKTRFRPNYLSAGDAVYIENGFKNWFGALGFPATPVNYKIDGGNFCYNGNDRAVVTGRVFSDNPGLTLEQLEAVARSMGITELAVLPEEAGDTTGHADGMIKWLSGNVVAVNNYSDKTFKATVEAVLLDAFPGVTIVTMPWNPTNRYWRSFADGTGVYVNAVTTSNAIYVPVYGLGSDDAAIAVYRAHADRRVIPVFVSPEIAVMGGAARCLSCQVYGEPVAAGRIPGAERPSLRIAAVKSRDVRGNRIFVNGRARSSSGISSVYYSDGKKTGKARLRIRNGRWWLVARANRNRASLKLRVYAFDQKGSFTLQSKTIRRR
jgi:agmatine/peptidylarginine deiminase